MSKNLKKKIKEMEDSSRPAPAAEEKLSFDQWWIMLSRRTNIRPSMKSIVWADFNARKLNKEELASRYDEALKLFGL